MNEAIISVNGQELTFRITALFQYRENYGAHAWDGYGACPQYWKNKGGHRVLLADGITREMLDDKTFFNMLVAKLCLMKKAMITVSTVLLDLRLTSLVTSRIVK